ncbi:MAG: histidine--tRNA ligase [Acidobacteriota bacterium]
MTLRAARGTRDVLPPEVERWQHVEEEARRAFALYGLQEIRTPVFEDSGVFEKGTGEQSEIVQKEMYRFTDLGDHDLTLRPEGTPPVVRAYLEHHLGDSKDLTKLYYIGPMFRYERPQKGRYRQFHQIGVEVFGSEAASVDAEVIDMAMFWLGSLGVEAPALAINSVGDGECRPAYRRALLEAQERVLDRLCDDCRRRHRVNPLRVFDCKKEGCRPLLDELPSVLDYLCNGCREHFDCVRGYLQEWEIEYSVSPHLVRGLDYYRRTVFEITSPVLGAQDALLGGGRYDGLVAAMGGADVPGMGFASGLERVVLALPERSPAPILDCYLVTVDESARSTGLALLRRLRRHGLRCTTDHQGRSMKAQMRAANRSGAPLVLIVGPDEVAAGTFTIKRMADGEQVTGSNTNPAASILELLK